MIKDMINIFVLYKFKLLRHLVIYVFKLVWIEFAENVNADV
jgi:hypothetical protein